MWVPIVATPKDEIRLLYVHLYSAVRLGKYCCRGGDQYARHAHRGVGGCPRVMVQHARLAVGANSCYHGTIHKLFERSEFLIDTSPKQNMCVRLILVLVWGRQTVYGENTVYLCLSKCIVVENTHTHSMRVTTAASETEGVPAVSWIESWIELCV